MKQDPLVYGALPAEHAVTSQYELCLFLGGSSDSFVGDLVRLIAKASPGERAALRLGFPREVAAWELWQETPVPLSAAKLDAAITRKLQKDTKAG